MRIYKKDVILKEDIELQIQDLRHYVKEETPYGRIYEVLQITSSTSVTKSKSTFKYGTVVIELKGMKLGHLIRRLNELSAPAIVAKLVVNGDTNIAELPATLLSDFSNVFVRFTPVTVSPFREVSRYSPIIHDVRELSSTKEIQVLNGQNNPVDFEYTEASDTLFVNTYPTSNLNITTTLTDYRIPIVLSKRCIQDTSILNYGGLA